MSDTGSTERSDIASVFPSFPADDAGPATVPTPDVAPDDRPAKAAGGTTGTATKAGPGDTTKTDPGELGRVDPKDFEQPFGRPGRPLRGNPFLFGLTAALGVLTAWLLVQAIASAGSALVLIIISLFLAIGLNPAVEALQRRNLSRRTAIAIVFGGVIAFFVVFGLAVVPPLTEQTTGFVQHLPEYVQQLQNHPLIRTIDDRYQVLSKLQQYVTSGDLASQMFGGLLGVAGIVISALFSGLTVLVLTLYFLGSLHSIKETAYRLVPRSRRTRVRLFGDEIIRQIGGYVAGNLIISLIAGIVTFLFLSVLGVPYALALAIFVAVTDLIPMVGAVVGAVVASGVGFLTSIQVGIACVIFFIVYQQIENYVISPPVFKSSVDVPPIATIIGALLGGALLGIVGALLGIPLAAAVLLLVREVVFPRQERV
ncbi:AI-2E family transporter [Sphaerisporangium melleum]|uniref:AI-2E family transporter n=1 Tax=Sphaerisporangium melleum TaxID=321316 RepID=A0A917R763_9ACTN|nr:AI-2E family transporter [Sphaerisporangium melleum]GGK92644.1 AI-2E family transporter [Sphaerisporangium melleum]GII73037.1 AI-2E family transporter [Sphaerisporangium melleum]